VGDLTLAQYQTEVILAVGNVPSQHPLIAAGIHTRAINRAPNRLIRMAPHLFPEHKDRSWEIGPTVVGDNRIAIPATCSVVRAVHSADDDTGGAPYPWEDIDEREVSRTEGLTVGLLEKDEDESTGFPQMWDRQVNSIVYYPTTRTGFETYLRLYGDSIEAALSASGDTFRIHADWDNLIVLMAAQELAMKLDRGDRARELKEEVKDELAKFNVVAEGDSDGAVSVEGMPTTLSVYGAC
jgi:hypothetical protein